VSQKEKKPLADYSIYLKAINHRSQVKRIMSNTRDDTKKYAQLHGIVSEMHQLEVRLYEMLETWDFKNSDEYWRLADQFHNLNTQLNRSVWKEHQDR
jgi:chemotaxis protein histidine kinase CheA